MPQMDRWRRTADSRLDSTHGTPAPNISQICHRVDAERHFGSAFPIPERLNLKQAWSVHALTAFWRVSRTVAVIMGSL